VKLTMLLAESSLIRMPPLLLGIHTVPGVRRVPCALSHTWCLSRPDDSQKLKGISTPISERRAKDV
jgi:hypothetical protein